MKKSLSPQVEVIDQSMNTESESEFLLEEKNMKDIQTEFLKKTEEVGIMTFQESPSSVDCEMITELTSKCLEDLMN